MTLDSNYWMPKASFPLWTMPVPCPDCNSTTFDNTANTITCSDCGWRPQTHPSIGTHEPDDDWHTFNPYTPDPR